ncbi:EAL domain-containing protein [Actinokineospora sp. NBRC 105648]|uniref:EAL domain-containing protein n=1 Tax=Actinokineospora sp. NBRC 105648 TaxID=3032206 RepID=UPI00249F96EA|nr:EAL domain-containing protein [Actinokineospora sp. NBRC 105648]GLZ36998.1 GGDEF domain-containing protein [Actinokineospora sp. NBRC 105648]
MTVAPDVSFAFQPMLSTRTGELIAVEALARPQAGGIYDLLRAAGKAGRLVETDISLASRAVLAAPRHQPPVPVHVNIVAATATTPDDLMRFLRPALAQTGRGPQDIVLEITPPFSRVHRAELIRGLGTLRDNGFRIAFDAVGDGDLPLSLLADVGPDLVKIDAHLIEGLPDDVAALAVVECLAQYCTRTGTRLGAVGVESEEQLLCLNRLGVRLAQGNLLARESRGGGIALPLPRPVAEIIELNATTGASSIPLVSDFLRPATVMSTETTAEDVRDTFAGNPTISGIVLVDAEGRPTHSLQRSRFLLAVTGLYGHALNARKPAARHADLPRTIRADATCLQLLDLVGDTEWDHHGDEIVVVDADRACVGVARLSEVVRGVAEAKIEQAAALNPLTRLPGSETVDREIDRRIERAEMFVVAWLDVDAFKSVNDTVGFAAGDDLIRHIGRALSDAERELPGTRVAHVGGDDFLVVADLDEITNLAARLVDRQWVTDGMAVSVSLASLVCGVGSVTSYRDASRLLAPLKREAKAVPGSSWVLGRPGTDRFEVLRGHGLRHHPQHARVS